MKSDAERHILIDEAEYRDVLAMLDETIPETEALQVLRTAFIGLDSGAKFVAGCLKAQFVEDVYRAMAEQGIKPAGLAKKLGKSRQYVTKVLNEKANFTFETIAEFSCALGMRVSARLYSSEERLAVLPIIARPRPLELYPEYKQEARQDSRVIGEKNAGYLAA